MEEYAHLLNMAPITVPKLECAFPNCRGRVGPWARPESSFDRCPYDARSDCRSLSEFAAIYLPRLQDLGPLIWSVPWVDRLNLLVHRVHSWFYLWMVKLWWARWKITHKHCIMSRMDPNMIWRTFSSLGRATRTKNLHDLRALYLCPRVILAPLQRGGIKHYFFYFFLYKESPKVLQQLFKKKERKGFHNNNKNDKIETKGKEEKWMRIFEGKIIRILSFFLFLSHIFLSHIT